MSTTPTTCSRSATGSGVWTYVAADREAYVQAAAGQNELVRLQDPSWLAAACILSVAGRAPAGPPRRRHVHRRE